MQKLYYSISEISKIVDEEQHILRYWEKEFNSIKPRKNRAGNRIYSEKDLSVIKAIKKLLREEKLNLKIAKEHISIMNFNNVENVVDELFVEEQFQSTENIESKVSAQSYEMQDLIEIKVFLTDLKKFLLN